MPVATIAMMMMMMRQLIGRRSIIFNVLLEQSMDVLLVRGDEVSYART